MIGFFKSILNSSYLEDVYYLSSIIGVFFLFASVFFTYRQIKQSRKFNLLEKKMEIYIACRDFVLSDNVNGQDGCNYKELHELYNKILYGKILFNSNSKIVDFLDKILEIIIARKNIFKCSKVDTYDEGKKIIYAMNNTNNNFAVNESLKKEFLSKIDVLFKKELFL